MAGEQGFEPWYAGIKIRCLNQLGDSPTQPTTCYRDCDCSVNHGSKQNSMRRLQIPASGWRSSEAAFQAAQMPVALASTASASLSLENAQNTHAPEPVILASPNCLSHSTAWATGGNK